MTIAILPADLQSLTRDERERLIVVVRERSGLRLPRGRFDDAVILLLEDIPGLERMTDRRCRQLLRSLWATYCSCSRDGLHARGTDSLNQSLTLT